MAASTAITQDASPRRVNLDALALAAPLLTLLVVAIIRKGAFFRPDIVVSPALTLALALSVQQVRDWARDHLAAVAAGLLATAWWIGDAELSHHSVDSWRLPAAWLCLASGYGCARSLVPAARPNGVDRHSSCRRRAGDRRTCTGRRPVDVLDLARPAFAALRRTLHLSQRRRSVHGHFVDRGHRHRAELATAPRRSPACARLRFSASCRPTVVVPWSGSRLRCAFASVRRELGIPVVAAVIGAPLLLLGQRTHTSHLLVVAAVIVAASLALIPDGVVRRVVRFVAVPAVCVVGWLLVTQHHAVSGFDASWTERGHILRGAVHVFAKHPLFGAGPDPTFGAHTLTGQAGIAYFTHNEPVEILISVGVIGTVVLVLCAVIVVRALAAGRGSLARTCARQRRRRRPRRLRVAFPSTRPRDRDRGRREWRAARQ